MHDLYKGFKKINEDNQKAVLRHDNGHELVISKTGINKKQRAQLSKLPLHQAEGTRPIEEEKDAGDKLKSIGAQITEAVAEKVVQGAEESLSPQQIQAMPEAVATDIKTGMPVAKGVGSEPAPQKAPLPPGPLASISPLSVPDMLPGETGDQYAARKQQEYDQYWASKKEQDQKIEEAERLQTERLGAPGIFSALQSPQQPTPTAEQPELAPEAQQRVVAEQPTAVPPVAPQAVIPPSAAPAPRPEKIRTPEEIISDPKAPLSQKLEAQNSLYMKNLSDLQAGRQRKAEILSKMEPKRVFNDASLGNKILMVIAAIAGGVGSGLTGRENAALKAIDDAFTRDWEAQKEDRTNKLSLHKLEMESLQDEMAARLQVMANYKSIMAAKMEEAERKYGMGSLAQKRVEAERLKIENEIQSLYQQISERKTAGEIKRMMRTSEVPTQATIVDPAPYLKSMIPDEKLREGVRKEIAVRKKINESAPDIMNTLEKVFKDYRSVKGQTVGRFKEPESIKDLKLLIRDIIPAQEGDLTGQQREAKVVELINLLEPQPGDVLFDRNKIVNRFNMWLTQNVTTPSADEAEINLQAFPATAINPESWSSAAKPEQGILLEDIKTKERFRGTPEQAEKAIQSGKYRRI